jgi:hypothetical protein
MVTGAHLLGAGLLLLKLGFAARWSAGSGEADRERPRRQGTTRRETF